MRWSRSFPMGAVRAFLFLLLCLFWAPGLGRLGAEAPGPDRIRIINESSKAWYLKFNTEAWLLRLRVERHQGGDPTLVPSDYNFPIPAGATVDLICDPDRTGMARVPLAADGSLNPYSYRVVFTSRGGRLGIRVGALAAPPAGYVPPFTLVGRTLTIQRSDWRERPAAGAPPRSAAPAAPPAAAPAERPAAPPAAPPAGAGGGAGRKRKANDDAGAPAALRPRTEEAVPGGPAAPHPVAPPAAPPGAAAAENGTRLVKISNRSDDPWYLETVPTAGPGYPRVWRKTRAGLLKAVPGLTKIDVTGLGPAADPREYFPVPEHSRRYIQVRSGEAPVQFRLWDHDQAANPFGARLVFPAGPGNPPALLHRGGPGTEAAFARTLTFRADQVILNTASWDPALLGADSAGEDATPVPAP